ncbi:F-box DNA helicase 1-like, partial [Notechis scutatus]|uniref:F-box DNA helicase 1-like n=1 Tax=Notechis scutatus TaxID=8663 RepID=A0A6J1W218_9SAUR
AISEDEWNLLYVAVTRAKKCLIIPKRLANILKKTKDYCVQFELATAGGNTTPLVCSEGECRNSIPADSLLIQKRVHFFNMDGTETPEGFLCLSCACSKHGPIAQLAGSSRMDQVVPRLPEGTEVPPEVQSLLEDF